MRAAAPFTSWDQLPIICGIRDVARLRNRSVKWVLRQIKARSFKPDPLPRHYAKQPLEWRKSDLLKWVEEDSRPRVVDGRRYFASAKRRQQAAAPVRATAGARS